MTSYELWFHELLGAYSIRLEAEEVTGVCGPFARAAINMVDPRKLRYDGRPEAIMHVVCEPDRFCICETWLKRPWPVPPLVEEQPGRWERARAWVWPRRTKKKAP